MSRGSFQFSVGSGQRGGKAPVREYRGDRPCVPYPVLRVLLGRIEARRWAGSDFGGLDEVSADAVGRRPEVTL